MATDASHARCINDAPNGSLAEWMQEASRRFGVSADRINAVIGAESAGNPRAVSPKGAMGLMQVMPKTWSELRLRYDLCSDPFDPRDNILAGTAYLRELQDRYGWPDLLAAYNAGPGRYEEYLAGRPLPSETQAYVATVLRAVNRGKPAVLTPASADNEPSRIQAVLFVERRTAAFATPSPSMLRRSHDQSLGTQPFRLGALNPQHDGLFVLRIGDGVRR
jgi:hypothetical protein